jgi:hypothetical protein
MASWFEIAFSFSHFETRVGISRFCQNLVVETGRL